MINFFLFLLIVIEGLIVSIITDNFAIFFFNIFFLSTGYLIISLMMNKTRKRAYLLLGLFYLISFSYTSVADIIYVKNPYVDFFVTPDSADFFNRADQGSEYSSISDIFDYSTDFQSSAGYIFSIGLLTHIAKLIDQPHSIIIKLFSVFSGGMITILLFFMLLKILDEKKSFKAALTFGLCSPVFFQSALILRDIHIMLLFSIMFYMLVEHKKNIIATLLTILIIYITYLFRPEHGLFAIIFLFFNLSYYSNEKSITKYIYLVFAIMVLIISTYKFNAAEQFENTTETYMAYSEEKGAYKPAGSSLGASLYDLPSILRVPSVAVFSQIEPLPIWAPIISDSENNPLRITQSIKGFFWYFVWCFIIAGFIFRKYITYPRQMLYLLIIPVLLILMATSEMNGRRIMAGYPILFCFSAYSYYNLEKTTRNKIIIASLLLYLLLHVIYLLIKI